MQGNQIQCECQLKELVKSIILYIEMLDEIKRDKKRRKSMNWKKRQER